MIQFWRYNMFQMGWFNHQLGDYINQVYRDYFINQVFH